MPVFRIPRRHVFPDPTLAEDSGLLGIGGDLDPRRVLLAYESGIFPWYSDDQPLLWWSPDPRFVLSTDALHVPRSLQKRLRRGDYRVTLDQAFPEVLRACADTHRPDQDGTWLTDDLQDAMNALHVAGHTHSVEAWQGDQLVGGLYGVMVGRLFCGESMFARASDASKVAFVCLVRQLARWGVPLIDCQVATPHLARFGAKDTPRADFLRSLHTLRERPPPPGPWRLDADLDPAGSRA